MRHCHKTPSSGDHSHTIGRMDDPTSRRNFLNVVASSAVSVGRTRKTSTQRHSLRTAKPKANGKKKQPVRVPKTAAPTVLGPELKGVIGGGYGEDMFTNYTPNDVATSLVQLGSPIYIAEARAYLVSYKNPDRAAVRSNYPPDVAKGILSHGVLALFQKCTHLGCKVPFCSPSQFFECPCHGTQYSLVGERRGGPSARGLDYFAVRLQRGFITIDTSKLLTGLADGIDVTKQNPAGPHCVGGGH
jgi:Rieske Fe-S protein